MSHIHSMPGHLIRRAQQVSNALFAEECAAFDLTSVQYAALTAIRENPGIDATRLCAVIAFDRSTIGDVLERIEAKGWIRRTPSETDRRARILTLTAAGETLLRDVEPSVQRVQQRLLEPFSKKEQATVLALLERLARMGEG
ncbi:MarR family winged helix-turn-helix transcriptional regulator [uncultured Alsobacter sp.]|uniref:MarR family winged helix-turn-helix transcriptional regulator n=1 Tax=uncultured Alsobacter sp. TaxID=1748258 RepID=UPI0025EA554C|nr:MarR family transcriptional regulator [uncultured Alsobacter sp.]